MHFNEFVKKYKPLLEQVLCEKLKYSTSEDILMQSIRYAVLNGGKRLRPLLTLAVIETFGGDPSKYLEVVSAVELIHTYSLIHDDLPAMDNDDFRRGQPTVHFKYGEDVAVLAGDALQAMAFNWLINPVLTKDQQITLVQKLSSAIGIQGMVGGQFNDMQVVNQSEISLFNLSKIHERKTGALLAYSCLAGGVITNLSTVVKKALCDFGFAFGLAFQIKDDLLDLKQDNVENKKSYPYLLGVIGAKNKLMETLTQAKLNLQILQAETDIEVVLLNDCLHYFDDMVEN